MLRLTRTYLTFRRSLLSKLKSMTLSHLARKVKKVSIRSTRSPESLGNIVIMKVAIENSMAAKERVVITNHIISTKMRKPMMTAMVLSMSRKKRREVVIAEVEEVALEAAAEASIVMRNMSKEEAGIDRKLTKLMKDLKRLRLLRSRPLPQLLQHRKKKKLRLLYLPRNSLAGTLFRFSDKISDIKLPIHFNKLT